MFQDLLNLLDKDIDELKVELKSSKQQNDARLISDYTELGNLIEDKLMAKNYMKNINS